MSCDCIERLEALLTDKMKEKFPDLEVVEPVEFKNKTWVQTDNGMEEILANPTIGRVRYGKSIRKYEVSMFPRFCPYCGKALG